MSKNRRSWKDMPKNPFSKWTGSDGKIYTHFESNCPKPEIADGELYGIPTGMLDPFMKASRDAVEFMSKQEGFVAIHPLDGYIMWFYDTLNHAKAARNNAEGMGIQCGNNISHFTVKDGVPSWDGIA